MTQASTNATFITDSIGVTRYRGTPVSGGTNEPAELDYVADLGGVADGVTDNYLKLAEAITIATTQKKTLRIPSGTYHISQRMVVTGLTGIDIVGDVGAVIKAPENQSFHMLTFRGCDGVKIRNLTIHGNRDVIDVLAYGQQGITFSFGTVNASIEGCTFYRINDCCVTDVTQGSFTADYNPPVGNVKDSHLIMTNNRFIECNSCFNTKGGGSSYGIISNNHYVKCNSAIKLDGEMSGGVATYTKKVTSWVISNNVCHDMGIGNVANTGVAVFTFEEGYENITLEGNEVNGFTGTDGIKIAGGQTNRTVNNVRVVNNRFSNARNAYGLRMEASNVNAKFTNVTFDGNEFITSTRGMIFMSNTGAATMRDVVFNNNKFIDWASGDQTGDTAPTSHCVSITLQSINKNISLTGNTWIRNNATYNAASQALRVLATTITSKNDLGIERNRILGLTATDSIVTILGSSGNVARFTYKDNQTSGGITIMQFVDSDVLQNWITGSIRFSGAGSLANIEYNRFFKGSDAYAMSISNFAARGKMNRYDATFTTDKISFGTGGTIVENPEMLITSPNGTHYVLSVTDAGVLSASVVTL